MEDFYNYEPDEDDEGRMQKNALPRQLHSVCV